MPSAAGCLLAGWLTALATPASVTAAPAAAPAASAASQAAGAAAFAAVQDKRWRLSKLDGAAIEARASGARAPHLIFSATKSRLSGSGGCNRIMGSFSVQGERLTIKHPVTTMMACPRGMEQEQRFIAALGEVQRWRLEGEVLELMDWSHQVLARLELDAP
ncbi:META domain-containing protein [Roseateles aquae]|nr:META domain-containing protein [Paucibacter sp. APW11]